MCQVSIASYYCGQATKKSHSFPPLSLSLKVAKAVALHIQKISKVNSVSEQYLHVELCNLVTEHYSTGFVNVFEKHRNFPRSRVTQLHPLPLLALCSAVGNGPIHTRSVSSFVII